MATVRNSLSKSIKIHFASNVFHSFTSEGTDVVTIPSQLSQKAYWRFKVWFCTMGCDCYVSFLKVVLKGLKQATCKGCSAWDVCEGKVPISNPNAYALFNCLKGVHRWT